MTAISLKNKSINLRSMFIVLVTTILVVTQYILVSTPHFLKKHGADGGAQSVLNCLDGHGSTKAYKFFVPEEERRMWTCFDGIDWYILITTKVLRGEGIDREYEIRTAYRLTDESIEQLEARKIGEGYIQVDELLEPGELFFEVR